MVASVTFRSKEKGEKPETNHYSHGEIYIWGIYIIHIHMCIWIYIYNFIYYNMYLLGPVNLYIYMYMCVSVYGKH